MYGLLHPDIDIVGVVTGYGNVTQEKATSNAAYLLQMAGREDIPVINGAKIPLSGDITTYYPEIHGTDGLGPIKPQKLFTKYKAFCTFLIFLKNIKEN